MIILKEKQRLDEMAILRVSSKRDGLPFRITIQSPETNHLPHAHIRDLKTGKVKLGEFAISKNPPRQPQDIKDFGEGITKDREVADDWRRLIFQWAYRPNAKYSGKITNWEALWGQWLVNEDI
jgi:hypothetical protein